MSAKYLLYKIKLTPLERFFFGGENVFGAEGAQSERRRSYLVDSKLLPQQSTLLGFLREQLLTQNDLLISKDSTDGDVKKAMDLVGKTGFSPDNTTGEYGLIQGLSPVQIGDESGDTWQPMPLDDREMPDKKKVLQPLTVEVDELTKRPFLKNLNNKIPMKLFFGNLAGKRKELEAFFPEVSQVGITMTNRVRHAKLSIEERKESYYYQTFRSNKVSNYGAVVAKVEQKELFSFVFYAKFSPEIEKFNLNNAFVSFGGERSAFRMEVEKVGEDQDFDKFIFPVRYRYNLPEPALKKSLYRLVLLCDAYADWACIKEYSAFVVSQTTPFRYFTTVLDKSTRFFDLKSGVANAKTQSDLHTLLSRGSVIYTDSREAMDKIVQHLNDQEAFCHIGYNYFQEPT